jgi:hypothetical protein
MLKGTYVFKQNGVEIGRSENIITTNGKNTIVQYLAGAVTDWASAIAVGAISTTASVSDSTLYYEVARTPVTLKSYIYGTPNIIVIKGTLANSVAANIYEIGVYPYSTSQVFGTRDQLIIDDFSNLAAWTGTYTTNAYGAQSPISPRSGLYSLNLTSGNAVTNNNLTLNLALYSTIDTVDLLVNVPSGSSGTLTLTLTDVNGLTSTIAYPYSTTGYQVLSQVFPSSVFSLSTVSSVSLSSTSNITVDTMRVSVNAELSSSASLVSRSVLSTPIAKIQGTPLDIEYYVQLS